MSLVRIGTQHVNPAYIESVGSSVRGGTVVQMQSGRSVTTTEPIDTIVDRINQALEASWP